MVNLEELKEVLLISDDSPSGLVWKIDKFCGANYQIPIAKVGDIVGWKNVRGYWEFKHKKKSYISHRVIYMISNNIVLSYDQQIDHLDGDRGNNKISNLILSNSVLNSRNKKLRDNSKTGVSGVSMHTNGSGNFYARATWQELDGTEGCKTFSFLKYGEETAMSLAKEYRSKMMLRLQEEGAGYSERHLQHRKTIKGENYESK